MERSIEETITKLLKYCRPGGHHEQRLLKIKNQVERNVMVGPKSLDFLNDMWSKMDNIECQHLTRVGVCGKMKLPDCPHRDKYRACEAYVPVDCRIRKNPLKIGVGDGQKREHRVGRFFRNRSGRE